MVTLLNHALSEILLAQTVFIAAKNGTSLMVMLSSRTEINN